MLPSMHLLGHLCCVHFAFPICSSVCGVCCRCNHHRAAHYTLVLNGSLDRRKMKVIDVFLRTCNTYFAPAFLDSKICQSAATYPIMQGGRCSAPGDWSESSPAKLGLFQLFKVLGKTAGSPQTIVGVQSCGILQLWYQKQHYRATRVQ